MLREDEAVTKNCYSWVEHCDWIPFLLTGGRTFLDAREIRDLQAFLAALINPLDEIALAGVLRGPLVGLTDEEIFRCESCGRILYSLEPIAHAAPKESATGAANS